MRTSMSAATRGPAKDRPICCASFFGAYSPSLRSQKTTSPRLGVTALDTVFSIVDLPQPFWPMTVTTFPRGTSTSSERRTSFLP